MNCILFSYIWLRFSTYSDTFDVSNKTKQVFIMAPIFLFFPVTRLMMNLIQVFSYNLISVVASTIINALKQKHVCVLFVENATLATKSIEETLEFVNHFYNAIKTFSLDISIKKTEVIHESMLIPSKSATTTNLTVPYYSHHHWFEIFKELHISGDDDEIVNGVAKATNLLSKLHLWAE